MGKSKIGFYGDVELIKKLENAGANIEDLIVQSLRKSVEKPSDEMLSFMRQHKRTGRTVNSWTEKLTVKDSVINFEAGFSVRKGGLPAIFWNYGTPRKAPPATWFVNNAIEKNIDEIISVQEQTLRNAFKGLM